MLHQYWRVSINSLIKIKAVRYGKEVKKSLDLLNIVYGKVNT